MTRKPVSWLVIPGVIGSCLAIVAMIFGNILAFGKQQAKTEQVEKDVEELDKRVDDQEKELNETKSDQRAIGKDIDAINEKLVEQKVMMQQVLDAVTKRR